MAPARRALPQQQVGERAARLERARLLQQLELEQQRDVAKAEVATGDLDDRRAPDVGTDHRLGGRDLVSTDVGWIHLPTLAGRIRRVAAGTTPAADEVMAS